MTNASRKNIVWLDDRPQRLEEISALRRTLSHEGFNLIGVLCNFESLSAAIKEITKSSPSLIIVDQFMSGSPPSAPQKGTAWAQILREEFGGAALVLTTGHDGFRPDNIQEYLFIDWFKAETLIDLSRMHDIVAITRGYESLWKSHSRRKKWIDLLLPPDSQIGLLEISVPRELHSSDNESKPHIFSRWIWNYLLKLPGFTYDSLGLATALGLKETGLAKISNEFKHFKYNGIFVSKSSNRWWVAEVVDYVRSEVEDGYINNLQSVGRQFAMSNGCTKKDFSVNYNTDRHDVTPNCVAYIDSSICDSKRVAIDVESTEQAPNHNSPTGFEELRIVSSI